MGILTIRSMCSPATSIEGYIPSMMPHTTFATGVKESTLGHGVYQKGTLKYNGSVPARL
jgi:hypothetical protein